jgi:hypothetical protein
MKKLERKQLHQVLVLSILFLAAMGYAVYQLFFTGNTGASTRSTSASTPQPAQSSQEQPATAPPWLSSAEPARDPFVVPPQFDTLRQSRVQSPSTTPTRLASAPNIGTLPPMPVVPVAGSTNEVATPVRAQPDASHPPEPEPNIAVTGVVIGERPVAIVRTEGGRQRIAQPGHQLEGGYVLRTVSREGIVLEKDGKTVTLRPGGNPNAK